MVGSHSIHTSTISCKFQLLGCAAAASANRSVDRKRAKLYFYVGSRAGNDWDKGFEQTKMQ